MTKSNDVHIEVTSALALKLCAKRLPRTSFDGESWAVPVAFFTTVEKLVDLWGGVRNKSTGEPWEKDTIVVVHSATKGLAAMTLAIAHSRGWLNYEERVCTYWPEFAQLGKERITVRQLLAHQAGLSAIDEPVDRSVVAYLDRLAAILARQKPPWEAGTRQGYHALTLGFYEGERRPHIDPYHRTAGTGFRLGKKHRSCAWRPVIRQGRRRRVHLLPVPPEQRAPIPREYVRIARSGRRHFPLPASAPLSDFVRRCSLKYRRGW